MGFDDLRDLRESTREDEEAFVPYEDDELAAEAAINRNRLFLGMTAIERMFLSIFLFMNVTVIGLALLLATGSIS